MPAPPDLLTVPNLTGDVLSRARTYQVITSHRMFSIYADTLSHARAIVDGRAFTYGTPAAPKYDQPCTCPGKLHRTHQSDEWTEWASKYYATRFLARLNHRAGERLILLEDICPANEGQPMNDPAEDRQPENPIITFIEARIAAEPSQRADALRALLSEILRYAEAIDYENCWGHTAEQLRRNECPDYLPDELPAFRALAAMWAGQPGYDPNWALQERTSR